MTGKRVTQAAAGTVALTRTSSSAVYETRSKKYASHPALRFQFELDRQKSPLPESRGVLPLSSLPYSESINHYATPKLI